MNLRRRITDRLWIVLSIIALAVAIIPLASIIYFVTANGISVLSFWVTFSLVFPPS